MAKYENRSFVITVLQLFKARGGNLEYSRDDIEYMYDALELAARAELHILGLDDDQIDELILSSKHPIDESSVLAETIRSAINSTSSQDKLPLLTFESYKLCFILLDELFFFRHCLANLDPEEAAEEGVELADIFSTGVQLGLMSHLIGWELDREINDSYSQSERGQLKQGVKTSIPNRAIEYAISKGFTVGKAVEEFFDENRELVEIGVSITPEFDRFDNKTGYLVTDHKSGKCKSIKLKSLSSKVSYLNSIAEAGTN